METNKEMNIEINKKIDMETIQKNVLSTISNDIKYHLFVEISKMDITDAIILLGKDFKKYCENETPFEKIKMLWDYIKDLIEQKDSLNLLNKNFLINILNLTKGQKNGNLVYVVLYEKYYKKNAIDSNEIIANTREFYEEYKYQKLSQKDWELLLESEKTFFLVFDNEIKSYEMCKKVIKYGKLYIEKIPINMWDFELIKILLNFQTDLFLSIFTKIEYVHKLNKETCSYIKKNYINIYNIICENFKKKENLMNISINKNEILEIKKKKINEINPRQLSFIFKNVLKNFVKIIKELENE